MIGVAPALEKMGDRFLRVGFWALRPFYQYTILPVKAAGEFLKYQRTGGLKPILWLTR